MQAKNPGRERTSRHPIPRGTRRRVSVDVGADGSVAALTRTAFNAILGGRPLSRAELVQATGASPEDVDRLAGRRLVLDADDRIVAAHGLSLAPARQHRLTMRGRRFWTWCAIDAVGIPAGLDEHAVVETTCHECGAEVRLELQGAAVVQASHPDARIWEAARVPGRGTAGPPHCALMNLFCSAEHLRAWREVHPTEPGEEHDLAQVGALGRAEWAYAVEPDVRSCGRADSCACPCHLPLLLGVLGGTSVGAVLVATFLAVFVLLGAVFVWAVAVGPRALGASARACARDGAWRTP